MSLAVALALSCGLAGFGHAQDKAKALAVTAPGAPIYAAVDVAAANLTTQLQKYALGGALEVELDVQIGNPGPEAAVVFLDRAQLFLVQRSNWAMTSGGLHRVSQLDPPCTDCTIVRTVPQTTMPPLVLAPGEARRIRLGFAGFRDYRGGPVRAQLSIPVNSATIELPIAEGATSSDAAAPHGLMLYGTGRFGRMFGGQRGPFLEPLVLGLAQPQGQFFYGIELGLGYAISEALMAGPPMLTTSFGLRGGWQSHDWPIGLVLGADYILGVSSPPTAYPDHGRELKSLPRVLAAVRFSGVRLLPASHSVDRRRSLLPSVGAEIGYMHLFNTGDQHGTGGVFGSLFYVFSR